MPSGVASGGRIEAAPLGAVVAIFREPQRDHRGAKSFSITKLPNYPMPLDLVFCGTPSFAVPTLEKLVDARFRVHLVVTQPDRPKGRGLDLVRLPVKESALRLSLPITQPDRIKANDEFRTQLTSLQPDAIIVVGYGRII